MSPAKTNGVILLDPSFRRPSPNIRAHLAGYRDIPRARPRHEPANGTATLPFVTIVMPLRNEATFSVEVSEVCSPKTTRRTEIEILVVDGRSTDGTREAIEALGRDHPRISKVVDNPAGIVAPGWNAALRRAHGEPSSSVSTVTARSRRTT